MSDGICTARLWDGSRYHNCTLLVSEHEPGEHECLCMTWRDEPLDPRRDDVGPIASNE